MGASACASDRGTDPRRKVVHLSLQFRSDRADERRSGHDAEDRRCSIQQPAFVLTYPGQKHLVRLRLAHALFPVTVTIWASLAHLPVAPECLHRTATLSGSPRSMPCAGVPRLSS